MKNFRDIFKREPYVPTPVPLAWVPNVEYYVVIIPATLAFLVSFIYFVGILNMHFYGIFDRDLRDQLYGTKVKTAVPPPATGQPPDTTMKPEKPPDESKEQPPEGTADHPPDSTDEPEGEPGEQTEEPAEQTEEPAEQTEEPAEQTEEPVDQTEEPAEQTEEPAEQTEEPAEQTEEPAEQTEEPGEQTEEPGEQPEESREHPADLAEKPEKLPEESREHPANLREKPFKLPEESREHPPDSTKEPVESSEHPPDSTKEPEESTEHSLDSTQTVGKSEESPEQPPDSLEQSREIFDFLDELENPEGREKASNGSKQKIEFRCYHTNLHLLLNAMVPFFIANGILIFRVACCYNRTVLKVLHTVLLVLPIPQIFISLPYIMAWTKFVEQPLNDQHFWSLHCWLGVLFIILFFITLISGIYVYFILPKKAPFESCEFRARFTPYHSFMGVVLFIICVMQVITGITSTAQLLAWDTWRAKDDTHTHKFGTRMLSLKITALLYAFSGMTVIYALYRDDFRYRGRIILTADPRDVH